MHFVSFQPIYVILVKLLDIFYMDNFSKLSKPSLENIQESPPSQMNYCEFHCIVYIAMISEYLIVSKKWNKVIKNINVFF